MKNKSFQQYSKKKRDITFKSFSEINFENTNDRKEKRLLKSAFNPSKKTCSKMRFHLKKGEIPIFSKNNKIILVAVNKYEKKFQKGKSPFFISDKLNFKTAFKLGDKKINTKTKHLGLCDYYSKIGDNNLIYDNELVSDDSKTPRFNKD